MSKRAEHCTGTSSSYGALFANTAKELPIQPDLKGVATIDGKKYWVSAWLKPHPKFNEMLSLSFTEMPLSKEKENEY